MFRAIAGTYLTKAWTALLGIVAVPFYAKFLGPEAFGIVSFVVLIQSAVNLLDFGLSSSITRQVAMHHAAGEREESVQTIRTLEIVYWAIGAVICILLLLCSQFGATAWLHPNTLSSSLIHRSLAWAALAVASLWPMTFYSGALMGMGRYKWANLVNATSLTLRQLGGALVAWLASGDLIAFFIWQFFASLLPVLIAGAMVWRASGVRMKSPARWSLIREKKGFLSGMALSTAAVLVFTQLDKVVLSRLLPLSEFGLYSLAWTAAGVFYIFYSPVASIGLPRFSALLAKGDGQSLARTYRIASQIVAAGVLPTTAVLMLFPRQILALWLRDKAMVEGTASLLQLLIPFAAVGALTYIPAVFQWAHGWTSLTSVSNLTASALLGPCIWVAYRKGGTSAAILTWGVLRLTQALTQTFLMHRRLLRNDLPSWLGKTILAPATTSFAVCLAAKGLLSSEPRIVQLTLVWALSLLASAAVLPDLSNSIRARLESLSRSWRMSRYPGTLIQARPEGANPGGSQ